MKGVGFLTHLHSKVFSLISCVLFVGEIRVLRGQVLVVCLDVFDKGFKLDFLCNSDVYIKCVGT